MSTRPDGGVFVFRRRMNQIMRIIVRQTITSPPMTPPTIGPALLLLEPEPPEDADVEEPGAGEVAGAPEDVKVGGGVPVDSGALAKD